MLDPFAVLFGAMCLALAFACPALLFGAWMLFRHLGRVRKFHVERTDEGLRWGGETDPKLPGLLESLSMYLREKK
jgi:hypothetical protein